MDKEKYQLSHSAKEIDEKFSAVLPIAELETVADVSANIGVTCTERDAAILEEMAAKKMPAVIRAKINLAGGAKIEAAAVFLYMSQSGNYGFKTAFMGTELNYGRIGGTWMAVVNTGA